MFYDLDLYIEDNLEGSDLIPFIIQTWLEEDRLNHSTQTNTEYYATANKKIRAEIQDPNTKIKLVKDKKLNNEIEAFVIYKKKIITFIWVRKERRKRKIGSVLIAQI